MDNRVQRLDLTGCDAAGAAERAADLVRDARSLNLLLVQDTADGVNAHREAFEILDVSGLVHRRLCVVVGGQGGAGDGLRLPRNIEHCTLWVTDPTGTDWALGASTARRHVVTGGDGLTRLLELLAFPDVFEQTHKELEGIPYGAAVPGLHFAGGAGSEQEDFLPALRTAIRDFLDPTAAGPPERRLEPPARAPLRLVRGGPLAAALEAAEQAVAEAQEMAGELPAAGSIVRPLPVADASREAGERLESLRGRIGDLFAQVPRDAPITPDRLDAIAARGVEPPVPDAEAQPVERLLDRVVAVLAAGGGLPGIDERLRERERELDRQALARPDDLCPDALLDRLRRPAPLPALQRWLPLPGAVFGALAGVSPVGFAGGLVLALLWTALLALTVVRGPAGRLEAQSGALGWNAFGAIVGGVAGGFAGGAATPPAVWTVAVAVAVAGALATTVYSWRSRAAQWEREGALDQAESALAALVDLLGAAVTEWAHTNARLAEAAEVQRLRFALLGVRAGLERERKRLENLPATLLDRPGVLSSYGAAVRHWLGEVVVQATRPALAAAHTKNTKEIQRFAAEELQDLVSEWDSVVNRGESAGSLRFLSEYRPPDGTDAQDLDLLARQAGHDPAGEMWQLCGPVEIRRLLNPVMPPVAVRFAPQTAMSTAAVPPGTVPVPSSAHCGVLRLVPLLPSIVEWTWTEDEPGGGER